MRSLPIGTFDAIWVGIGAVLTVTYARLTGEINLGLNQPSRCCPDVRGVRFAPHRAGRRGRLLEQAAGVDIPLGDGGGGQFRPRG